MADDDTNTGKKPAKPETSDTFTGLEELPSFPDREEFVRTMEMDSPMLPESHTRPMMKALDPTTKRFDIPDAVMEVARGTAILEGESRWLEFEATVDSEGKITLPKHIQKRLATPTVRVRIKLEPT